MRSQLMKANAKTLPVTKADEIFKYGDDGVQWISAPYQKQALRYVVEQSTVLQQVIEAYKQNIVGFGFRPKYIEEGEETDQRKAEWNALSEVLDWMAFDKTPVEEFEQAIEDRETVGESFMEVLRDAKNNVIEVVRVEPDTMEISKPGYPVEVTIERRGVKKTAYRKFRKFRLGKVFFREFGDPRYMDAETGEYKQEPPAKPATEIIHDKIGPGHYGAPRWIGHVPSLTGARKAEELNWRYFDQGRHTPMAITVTGGQLTPEAETALASYTQAVGNEELQHKILVLEAETTSNGLDDKNVAKVEIKSLADMLQKDALFLDYDDKTRDKILSAFRLPPVYIGLSNDYNRATVEAAKELAEEQVFQPERNKIENLFNRRLLPSYGYKYVEVELGAPEIVDGELITKVIAETKEHLTTNEIRTIVSPMFGVPLKMLKGEEYDLPQQNAPQDPLAVMADAQGKALAKAENGQLAFVLKDVRDSLDELNDVVGGWKGEDDV